MSRQPAAPPERLLSALAVHLPALGLGAASGVSRMKGDASTREYFRISAGNRTIVAMVLPEGAPSSLAEEVTKADRAVTELPFVDVARDLRERGVRVPQVFAFDTERGVLLIEDFGDRLLADEISKMSRQELQGAYELALEMLARVASVPEGHPRTSISFARRFDKYLFNWEFLHFVEYALDHRCSLPPADRRLVVSEMERLTAEYVTWPTVFCHRDYHSRNLMLLEGKSGIGVLDFQDALLAPAVYDLASLLRDSYTGFDKAFRHSLAEEYRLRLRERDGFSVGSADEFRRAFDLIGIHRNLKAAGRFLYIDEVKRNSSYLRAVPQSLAYVMETLQDYGELSALRDLLSPHIAMLTEVCRA